MGMHFSTLIHLRRLALLLFFSTVSVTAYSQNTNIDKWPREPLTIMVPYAAGGSTDSLTRIMAKAISESVGFPVVVENKPGATGVVGTGSFLRSTPNGHSFELLTSIQPTVNQFLYKLNYDPAKDFNYVGMVADIPDVIVVSSKSKYHSLAELIKFAKANPGKLNYSNSGVGGSGHLLTEQLNLEAGIKTTQIPYAGNGPATVALISNQVDYQVDSIAPLIAHMKAGSVRALAVTSPKRLPEFPDVPTIAELGYPNGTFVVWYALIAQPSTSKTVIKLMNAEVRKALKRPDVIKQMKLIGFDPRPSDPEEVRLLAENERARWKRVINAIGLKQQ